MIDHQNFRELVVDETGEPADLDAHAAACEACASWRATHERITRIAPDLADVPHVDLTQRILWKVERNTRRVVLLRIAAACLLVAVGVGVVVAMTRPAGTPDQLASIADDYQNGEPFRFVLTADATVTLATTELDSPSIDTPLVPFGSGVPLCDQADPQSDDPGPIDLEPLLERLLSDDPCAAVRLLDSSLSPDARAAVQAATSAANTAREQVAAATSRRSASDLEQQSLDVFVDRREEEIERLDAAVSDLVAGYAEVAADLVEVVDTSAEPSLEVSRRIVAFSTTVDRTSSVVDLTAPEVRWTQIATGTWSPTSIELSGTVEADDITVAFDSVDADPLALASAALATPEQLIDLLRSAPNSDDSTISWPVPASLIAGPGEWTARATIEKDTLRDLTLTTGSITVTFIPAR